MVMLNAAIEANYGREKANEYDLLNAWFSKEVSRFLGERGFSSLLGRAGWRENNRPRRPRPGGWPTSPACKFTRTYLWNAAREITGGAPLLALFEKGRLA